MLLREKREKNLIKFTDEKSLKHFFSSYPFGAFLPLQNDSNYKRKSILKGNSLRYGLTREYIRRLVKEH